MADVQLVPCPKCGAHNRVPKDKLEQGLQPVCGRCKARLPGTSQAPLTVTDASFSAEVERSPVPVLVDMWAPWCGPCRALAPIIDQLASEMKGRVRVVKLNIDDNPVTAEHFNVRSIPALVVIKGGREVDRMLGAQPKTEIRRRLEKVLAS